MSVKEIDIKCRVCGTEFTANYEINQNTLAKKEDSFGNILTRQRKSFNVDTITVSIQCPNPECNKKNWVNVEVLR